MKKAQLMSVLVLAVIVACVLVYTLCLDDMPAAARASDEPAAERPTNRLSQETSPYLLQHQHNPVDWYPWGEEAFAKAKAEDKPVFLSVGYSTCHWCHVMAHESFEDDEVAAILNEHFIAIKVDREERPDVDTQYMLATQMLTRRGGWPNSVWLTPDGRPWFAGTYFPKEDAPGQMGFMSMLRQLNEAWTTRRGQMEQRADKVAEAIQQYGSLNMTDAQQPITPELIQAGVAAAAQGYDRAHGGFGDAPKFPPHGRLALLIDAAQQESDADTLNIITHTLDAMAMGGMYDHVGGAFHRYSTDARWFLPHFEKMLYDNAQLLRIYTDGYVLTQHDGYRRIVADIVAWLERDMLDEAGGFYSALDADSEGEEGKFYVWARDEIIDVLGEEDGELFCAIYGIQADGNFVDEAAGRKPGTNVLYLPTGLARAAKERDLDVDTLRKQLTDARAKLLDVRQKRVPPHLDDKVLTAWNAMMIEALAYAGRELDEPRYVELANGAADFLLTTMVRDGQLLRTSRAGEAKLNAYLDDYALLIGALVELHATTGDAKRIEQAVSLADRMLADFQDSDAGGFFYTPADHDELIFRSKDLLGGGNVPSGNGSAALALTHLAAASGEERFAIAARDTLRSMSGLMSSQPAASETVLLAAAQYMRHDLPPLAEAAPAPDAIEGKTRIAHVSKPPVTVEAFADQLNVQPGDTINVDLRLTIDEPFHVYANDPGVENLIATSVSFAGRDGTTLGDVMYPEPKQVTDATINATVNVYEGQVIVTAPIHIDADAQPAEITVVLAVTTQACDNKRCLLPRNDELELEITIGAEQ